MTKVFVTDGVVTVIEIVGIIDEDVADELARDYVDQGEYGEGPVNVSVSTRRFSKEDGEILREWSIRVMVYPDVPDCAEGKYDVDHAWESPYNVVGGCKENPGVWGSEHGGIKSREVCSRCGMYMLTDTGDTDYTGQRYTSIKYKDADEVSLTWIEEEKE